jgi:hypothetical protein
MMRNKDDLSTTDDWSNSVSLDLIQLQNVFNLDCDEDNITTFVSVKVGRCATVSRRNVCLKLGLVFTTCGSHYKHHHCQPGRRHMSVHAQRQLREPFESIATLDDTFAIDFRHRTESLAVYRLRLYRIHCLTIDMKTVTWVKMAVA